MWSEIVLLALALWIVTHTIAEEIPITARAPKPVSCQLCLAGWTCLAAGATAIYRADVWGCAESLSIWALAVLIESLYQHLRTLVL